MKPYEIVNKIIIENDCVFLSKAPSDLRPLSFTRAEEPSLTEALRAAGLQAMLAAVLRRVYRGEYRLRAQSRLTRALRESIHAFPMELIGRLDEDTVVWHLSAAAEKLLADPDCDPAEELTTLLDQFPPQEQTRPQNEVRVRLLGRIELENARGRVEENPARPSLPWMLLKYLLVSPERGVDLPELLREAVWPCSAREEDEEGSARVRLRRLRESLRPLGLDGKQGLVLFSAGKYRINPAYVLRTDVGEFSELMEELAACPEEDPEGLQLCCRALELFRGPYMEHTGGEPWLERHRDFYDRAFEELVRAALRRSEVLKRYEVLSLLCRRAAASAPENESLQQEIISFLVKHGRETELMQHMTRIIRSGKAAWLQENEMEQAVGVLP